VRLLLIFNPHAAAGRAARLLGAIRGELEKFATVICEQTERPGHARQIVAGTDPAAYDGVVAAGGDGTLFEVLNGMYAHDANSRPPLGVIPVGTGNAFARELGLMPGDWEKGVGIIAGRGTRKVDVGHVRSADTDFHFLNIVGVGLPVDAMLTAKRLSLLGRAAYSVATLLEAMRLKVYPLEISMGGDTLVQKTMFVEVSNTRYTGTSFLIAPAAEMDDGLLDLTMVRELSRFRLLRLFPTIYSGRHVEHPEVIARKVRQIRIEAPAGLILAPDGELCGRTPATISCRTGDLEIFCP
jgi:diacylglycerol kinase (ATP)